MSAIAEGSALHTRMRQWRQDFHAHPEIAYEEHRTAAIVAELLAGFGLEVSRGWAGTGVVAVIEGRHAGSGCIGLRADIDALPIQELNTFAHRSTYEGRMHACGHDGHTAMLLGAAQYLAEHRDFAGRLVLIFQPAEEGRAGAKRMCEEGLFEHFPVDAVYALHNWPGLATGAFAIHAGAVMASMDVFDARISGRGCHGGMPHMGVDPIAVAGQVVSALQNIVSRQLDPFESGVVSVTRISSGEAYNVVPDEALLSGTTRTFNPEVQDLIETRMGQTIRHICQGMGARGELDYRRVYPSTINAPEHAERVHQVCAQLVGEAQVHRDLPPSMGAEDFAFFLQRRPGAYIWIGNGEMQQGRGLHNPYYDFNDAILPLGANYWVRLVQQLLAA